METLAGAGEYSYRGVTSWGKGYIEPVPGAPPASHIIRTPGAGHLLRAPHRADTHPRCRPETMKPAGVGALLLVLSVTLSAAPADRHKQPEVPQQQHRAPGWSLPLRNPPSREKRNLMEKRKCNTATCVTQRLADFLVRSNTHHHAPVYSPTNVGSFTYGKRDVVGLLRRESFDYLHH